MAKTCRLCDQPSALRVGGSAKSLCRTHGERWRRWGKPDVDAWVAAFLAGRLNTCVVCGRGFNGYLGQARCGPECDRKRRAEISLARYYAMTPEDRRHLVDVSLARERAKRAAKLSPKTCPLCHETFMPRKITGVCPKPECARLRRVLYSRKSHHAERNAIVLRTIQERLNEPD